jgi:hypothetical protein
VRDNWLPELKEMFSSESGDTVAKAGKLIAGAWDAIAGASERIGGAIAGALLSFIELPDYDLGEKIGWVAGMIIFEVAMAVLTGGAYEALQAVKGPLAAVLKVIVEIHKFTGEAFEAIIGFIKPLKAAMHGLGELISKSKIGKALSSLLEELTAGVSGALSRTAARQEARAAEAALAKAPVFEPHGAPKPKLEIETPEPGAATGPKAAEMEPKARPHEDPHATPREEPKPKVNEDPEAAAAREKRVEQSGKKERLNEQELGDEIDHVSQNPQLVEGTPPGRKVKIGEHEWREGPDGVWCRFSEDPTACVKDLVKAGKALETPTPKAEEPPATGKPKAEEPPATAKPTVEEPAPPEVLEPTPLDDMRGELNKLKAKAKKTPADAARQAQIEDELAGHYKEIPGESPEAMRERLFKKDPRESLADYRKRLADMEGEVSQFGGAGAQDEYLKARIGVEQQMELPGKLVKQTEAELAPLRAKTAEKRAAWENADARLQAAAKAESKALEDAKAIGKRTPDESIATMEARDAVLRKRLAAAEARVDQAEAAELAARSELKAAETAEKPLQRKLELQQKAAKGIDKELSERLRKGTPTDKITADIRAKNPVDEVYGLPPKTGEGLAADHIVSKTEIQNMDGFVNLHFDDQLKVLNYEKNFMAMHPSVNSSKGIKTWREWDGFFGDPRFGTLPPGLRAKMIAREDALREELKNLIKSLQPK